MIGVEKNRNKLLLALLLILPFLGTTSCGGALDGENSPAISLDEPGTDGIDIPITIAKVELDPHRIYVEITEDSITFSGQEEAVSPYLENSLVHLTNTITGKHFFTSINSDGSFNEITIAVDDLTDPIRLTAYYAGTEGAALFLEADDLNSYSWFDEEGNLIFSVEEDGTSGDSKTVKGLAKDKSDYAKESEPEESMCDVDEADIEKMAMLEGIGDDYTILENNCEFVVQDGQSFYYVDGEKLKLFKVLYVGYEKIKKAVLSEDGSTLGVLTDKYIYLVDLASGSIKKTKLK